jgi:NADH dehydrogenase
MRVVVLGAGYAGLTLARRLESSLPDAADLVVVDESPDHLVQHELHRAIRRPAVADAITVPLDDVLDRATVVTDRVESVDRDARRIDLTDRSLAYDYAAICLGAETAFHGLPGVAEHGLPLKRLAHADRIREAFLGCPGGGRTVVGGAGLSGVQVAGELAALADEEGMDVEIRLLERLDAVAPAFPPAFQSAVRDALDGAGVAVETGVAVTGASADTVTYDGTDLPYDAFVWTGGIRGPDALGGERPVVGSDLRLDDRTFAVGDTARVVDADGEAVPASAAAAVREARAAADSLVRLVDAGMTGESGGFDPRIDPFRFEVPGWVVSVGDDAVAQVGPTLVTGAAARGLKATVGAGHLSSVGSVSRAAELVRKELR